MVGAGDSLAWKRTPRYREALLGRKKKTQAVGPLVRGRTHIHTCTHCRASLHPGMSISGRPTLTNLAAYQLLASLRLRSAPAPPSRPPAGPQHGLTRSTSGRSSRSTFTFTNSSFMRAAVSSHSKLSRSITWHQWHVLRGFAGAAYRAQLPTSTGLPSLPWQRPCFAQRPNLPASRADRRAGRQASGQAGSHL